MFEPYLTEEIKQVKHLLFVSPHLDDAIFSAGGLLSYLANRKKITVVNVFTSCGSGKNTFSAKRYLRQCAVGSARRLYEIRLNEDRKAFAKLNIPVINLGFTDALWREKEQAGVIREALARFLPEFKSLYPIYKFHVLGKMHDQDKKLLEEIEKKLKGLVEEKAGEVLIFCPAGFGNHVDHMIVKKACQELTNKNLIYWSDFPYYLKIKEFSKSFLDYSLNKFEFRVVTSTKKELAFSYHSQINKWAKDKSIFYSPETYFFQRSNSPVFNIQIQEVLDQSLLKEWQELWQSSVLKHYFNSPAWFLACLKTFTGFKTVFVKCYGNNKLLGIVPLVKVKKYAISAYTFSGGRYLAKSPILLAYPDTRAFIVLVKAISGLGNFFLNEISGEFINFWELKKNKIRYAVSSVGSFLPLTPSPLQYLNPSNKKKILKKMQEAGGNINLQLSPNGFLKDFKLMEKIESQSTKVKEFKAVLSDSYLRKLYKNLGKQNKESLVNYFLYYNKEAVCYRSGFIYGDIYHGAGTAYKAEYADMVPGKISVFLLLHQLKKRGIKFADFSRGLSPLKRDFTPFTYKQYLIFYAKNPFIALWWRIIVGFNQRLKEFPFIFEVLRKGKQMAGL